MVALVTGRSTVTLRVTSATVVQNIMGAFYLLIFIFNSHKFLYQLVKQPHAQFNDIP